jgi:hypothetical protein
MNRKRTSHNFRTNLCKVCLALSQVLLHPISPIIVDAKLYRQSGTGEWGTHGHAMLSASVTKISPSSVIPCVRMLSAVAERTKSTDAPETTAYIWLPESRSNLPAVFNSYAPQYFNGRLMYATCVRRNMKRRTRNSFQVSCRRGGDRNSGSRGRREGREKGRKGQDRNSCSMKEMDDSAAM